jgi:hypothetical protein
MYSWCVVYSAILFFILTPGILLTLPKGGSKFAVAATHALVFAIVLYFTIGIFVEEEEGEEGFRRRVPQRSWNRYFR